MKRREFITLLGGAAAAWPVAARAQQAERVRRIGLLMPGTSDDAENQTWVGSFLQGLRQSGWTIGSNLRIDTRWATSQRRHSQTCNGIGRARAGCDSGSWQSTGSAAAGDPHRAGRVPGRLRSGGTGIVDSLARPGGNVTGFASGRIQHRAENGSNCSSKWRRDLVGRRSFGILPTPPDWDQPVCCSPDHGASRSEWR